MVSAIIVTYNNLRYLKDCIWFLQSQSFQDLETIVIFNNLQDNCINNIRKDFSKVSFIINNENLLYCKAYNQGIRQSKGEYVLCINDDVILEENFIEEVVKTISIDKRIGMVSGKILRMDRITIDSTGLFLGKSRKPIERGFNQNDKGQYNKEEYIFGVSGAAAFYRRAMLEDIKNGNGYFDERYGMFYEDLDLAWRANTKGWRAYYNPKAVAYHKRGASAKTISPKSRFLRKYNFAYLNDELKVRLVKNRYMTIIKNDSFWGIILNLPFILAYEIKLYLYLISFSPKLLIRIFKESPDIC